MPLRVPSRSPSHICAEFASRRRLCQQRGPGRALTVGDGDTIYPDFVEEHGYAVHHFGVPVADLNEALAQVEAAGYSMVQDGSGLGVAGDGHAPVRIPSGISA
jgi:methylmalonyl-CoA/ethylmalonyl-CoA epimerase